MRPSQRALDYVASYRDAFIRRDVAGVASHYAEPMLAYSAGNKVLFQDRQVAAPKVAELLAVYASMGMEDAEVLSMDTVLHEGDIEEVFLEWCLYGKDRCRLISFKTSYTLLHGSDRTECLFAISHNEVSEIRKFFATRKT